MGNNSLAGARLLHFRAQTRARTAGHASGWTRTDKRAYAQTLSKKAVVDRYPST